MTSEYQRDPRGIEYQTEPGRRDDDAETAREREQDPDRLERDIERTRADMGRTMEEIGDRVSPRRIYERRTDAVRTRWRGLKRRVFGDSRYEYGTYYGTYDVGGYGGYETGGGQGMQQRLREGAEEVQDRIQHAPEELRHQVQGNPMAAGLIAFGAGLLAGSMMSETRAERQMMQKARPQMEAAREQLRSSAQHIGEDVRQTAAEEAEHLKESASEAASHVQEETRQAAEETRRQAG